MSANSNSGSSTEIGSAEEYFELLTELGQSNLPIRESYRQLHYLLEQLCRQLTRGDGYSYPNLFSRLNAVCDSLPQSPEIRKQLSKLRIQCNRVLHNDRPESVADLPTDIKRLAYGIECLLNFPAPSSLQGDIQEEKKSSPVLTPCVRATVHQNQEGNLQVILHDDPDNKPIPFRIRWQEEEKDLFSGSLDLLRPGMQLNLLHGSYDSRTGYYEASIIVTEPDFLIDISSVAECFKPYGSHPLNYWLGRLSPTENTQHLLLGNIANLFLDELVNETPDEKATYEKCMQKAFRQNPFGITSCRDLSDVQTQQSFFKNTREQFEKLCHIVREIFPASGIDKSQAVLEPSFICETLGLQGRLDLLANDYSSFIELKSGKARESADHTLVSHGENHYVQMILYFAVLHYNVGIDYHQTRAYLLYSRYPQLYRMSAYQKLIKQAIDLRNRIVTSIYRIQQENDAAYSLRFLQAITADQLNEKHLHHFFWENYLRKPIDHLNDLLKNLSSREQEYVASLFTFITKEQYISNAGESLYESHRGASLLWKASTTEKLDAGEIIVNLLLTDNRADREQPEVVLSITETNDTQPPNFRNGDMVLFYRRDSERDNACNQQIFKGSIESIDMGKVVLRLRNRQRNRTVLPGGELYALERDYLDTGTTVMYQSLGYFLRGTSQRRDLLLSQRNPRYQTPPENKNEDDIDRIVSSAMHSSDYYLLVGPPGTGKTSQALRKMVASFLEQTSDNILLIAYTNKAVDEICHTLLSLDSSFPFIRIGQEASCEEVFRPFLLQQMLNECSNRTEVNARLESCRIFVATLTSLSTRMDLFRLKHFGVAIIDEASQILEPQLLGILSVTDPEGKDAIDRFILIGDYKQLPAVVLQSEKESEVTSALLRESGITNLRESLFERLYRHEQLRCSGHSPVCGTLISQGRMHPEISAFPSAEFYNNRLQPIPLPHQEEELEPTFGNNDPLADWLSTRRLAFLPVISLQGRLSGKVNIEEARLTARIAAIAYRSVMADSGLFDPIRHLGIITPYRNQIAAIRKELRLLGINALNDITVDTVERFQGGQRDVIIFSCCIHTQLQLRLLSNTLSEDGRLIDRKLNVALTRARKQMIVIGNPLILRQDPIYDKLLNHIEKCGGYLRDQSKTASQCCD